VPEKTVTRSFRINESAFLALEEEAKKRNISLNTLVNQLFMSYANFDRYFQRLGMLKMSKVTFRKILNAAPANEIVEVAREVAQNSSRIIILARYGTLSLTSVLVSKTLSGLLSTEEQHQIKKRQLFREFTVQRNVFE
jgi:hypothetical protein